MEARAGLRQRDYPGWRMVWALSVTETVNYGVLLYAVAVFLTPMRRDLHVSLGELSGAISLSIAVTGLLAPLVGAWLDRHGARLLMTVGSVVGGASVVGWSQSRSLPALYASFVGIGIASAAVLYDCAFAVVNVWFDRDRQAALLTITVVAGFASTVFLPLSQALEDALGWRDALLALAALVLATAVPHAILLRRHPADQDLLADGAHRPTDDPPAPGLRHDPATPRLCDPELRASLASRSVRWLTAATVALTTGVAVVVVYLVSYLRAHGYSPGTAAFGAGAIGILSVTGRIALSAMARRLRLARVTATMLAGQVVGVAALARLPKPAGLVVFVVAFGAGYGVMTIARAALLGRYVPARVFARVSGVQALVTDIGRVAAPVTVGVLIAWTGSYSAMLLTVSVCSAVASWSLLMADRHDLST
jgi:MFS family permease